MAGEVEDSGRRDLPEVDRLRAALTEAEWALTRLLTNTPAVLWLDHWIRGELLECEKALRVATEALAPRSEEASSGT